MMVRRPLVGLILILAVLLAACGGAAQIPNAPASEGQSTATTAEETPMAETMSDDMMPEGTPTAESTSDDMMSEGTPTAEAMPDDTMSEETPTAEAMPDDMMSEETPMAESTADDMMSEETPMAESTSEAMMPAPAWFGAELTDVNTGRPFSIADLQGKVVLVETMAIWCPKCLAQQQEVQALRTALGPRADLAIVVLDVDPNEDAASLQTYAARHGFDWTYAVAPREVAREIGQLYGDQFLNPTATPMLIIDRHGEVHTLPFGAKSADALETALEPLLDDGM